MEGVSGTPRARRKAAAADSSQQSQAGRCHKQGRSREESAASARSSGLAIVLVVSACGEPMSCAITQSQHAVPSAEFATRTRECRQHIMRIACGLASAAQAVPGAGSGRSGAANAEMRRCRRFSGVMARAHNCSHGSPLARGSSDAPGNCTAHTAAQTIGAKCAGDPRVCAVLDLSGCGLCLAPLSLPVAMPRMPRKPTSGSPNPFIYMHALLSSRILTRTAQ